MAFLEKTTNYLKESLQELKKVVWPTKKQLVNYTLIVFGLFFGLAIFFAVLDYFFTGFISALIK